MLTHSEMKALITKEAHAELIKHGYSTTPEDLLPFYEGMYDAWSTDGDSSFEKSMWLLALIDLRMKAHRDIVFKK